MFGVIMKYNIIFNYLKTFKLLNYNINIYIFFNTEIKIMNSKFMDIVENTI